MKTQTPEPLAKHGSLPAGAFAALLLLAAAGAPLAARDIEIRQNTDSSEASSSGSSGGASSAPISSTSSSPSSGSSSSSRGSGGNHGGGNHGGGHGGGSYGGGSNSGGGYHEGGGGRGDGGRGDGGRGDGGGYHGDRGGRGGGYGGGGYGGGGYGRGEGRGGGHGHGGHYGGRRGGYYGGYGGYGGYYGWGGWGGWGWGGWWPWYPGWGSTVIIEGGDYGHPYGVYQGEGSGALDLDLSPEKAQIFVDGNYVGTADDYDGFPTYLWLEPGTYDIAFFLPGFETIVRQYTIRPGALIDVEDHLVPGESIPPQELMRPKSTERRDARIERNAAQEAEVDRREAETAARGQAGDRSEQGNVGRLYLSLWPPDAAIYLDGHFLGTAEELGQLSAGLVVEPGDHDLEVVRPGYTTVHRKVTVPAGERIEVKFDLGKN